MAASFGTHRFALLLVRQVTDAEVSGFQAAFANDRSV
jgi:hypothetical protein